MRLNRQRSKENKSVIIRHLGIGLLAALLLVGGPIYAAYGPLGAAGSDAVSSATVIIEQPSGAYVVMINRDRHPKKENLDIWIQFFSGGDMEILFEDISCLVMDTDAAGLEIAKSLQSRLPENQMKLRTENATLLLSKAKYGEFDMILVSREAYDAYGAQVIGKESFVETIEAEGVKE